MKIHAIFGGKNPHPNWLVGGVPCAINIDDVGAVRRGGNKAAQALCTDVFATRDEFEWRGLGSIPDSALRLSDKYTDFDAELRFATKEEAIADHKACSCPEILRGEKTPPECKVFATGCTPETPLGSCMVSPEGACAAHYLYGRFRDTYAQAAE